MNELLIKEITEKNEVIAEYKAKAILKDIIPVTEEHLCATYDDVLMKAQTMGYPLVLKGYSEEMTHKTEHDIIHLNISNETDLKKAYNEIEKANLKLTGILVQKMIKGSFELVMGLVRDPNFGPAVMIGLGGVYTELFKDVSFRIAPLTIEDALEMMDELAISPVFDNYRKMDGINKNHLGESIVKLGNLALEHPEIQEIDINPLIISDGNAIAVDALIILKHQN